jgi:hypothetical protein
MNADLKSYQEMCFTFWIVLYADEVLAKNIDYRQQVIRDLLEKEQEFVSDLR